MQAVLVTCTREPAYQDHYSEILFTQKWNERELASEFICCVPPTLRAEQAVEVVMAVLLAENELKWAEIQASGGHWSAH